MTEFLKKLREKRRNESFNNLYLSPKIEKLQKLPIEQRFKQVYEWARSNRITLEEFMALVPIMMQ
jgi:hypothetical protein